MDLPKLWHALGEQRRPCCHKPSRGYCEATLPGNQTGGAPTQTIVTNQTNNGVFVHQAGTNIHTPRPKEGSLFRINEARRRVSSTNFETNFPTFYTMLVLIHH